MRQDADVSLTGGASVNQAGASPQPAQETAVTVERRGHVLLTGFSRPAKRNAFNLALLEQLAAGCCELEADDDLRCGRLSARPGRALHGRAGPGDGRKEGICP